MAINDITFDSNKFYYDTEDLVGGSVIHIDFPFGVFLFLPYHGYITKSRLIGGY